MVSAEHDKQSLGVVRVKPALRRTPNVPSPGNGSPDPSQRRANPVARFFKILGPGLITGASDDDPSGIITYAVAGATLGFSILWTALFTIPLMMAMQAISARIGLVSGQGIASVIKQAYGRRWILYPAALLVLVANTINIGADIGAIAGAIQLDTGVPSLLLVVPVTIVILVMLTFGSYHLISTIFKWLTLPLFAYFAACFLAHPSISGILKGTFYPSVAVNRETVTTFVAIMGTTITPYLWFWQANQEVEETKGKPATNVQDPRAKDAEIRRSIWDIATGMVLSNLVMYAIIVATGATLFQSGHHTITSSADAAAALKPAAGSLATLLFSIGIIGAGMLAVPILAGSASYAVGESFGWQVGIDRPWYRAKQFYAVIAAACLIGMSINFLRINPISALFYTAVINGLIAPPLMVLIMLVSNDGRIMGTHVNNRLSNLLGWTATAVMTVAAIVLLITL